MKDYDAPEPAKEFDKLATQRPGTVTAAIVILSIGVVFAVIFGLILVAAQSQASAGVLLAIGVINGVALVFVARGFGLARFVIIAVGALGLVIDVISGSLTFGDALWVLAVVLMFLPASNLFFDARATVRRTLKNRGK